MVPRGRYHNAIAQATQAVPPYRPNGTVCENPWQDVHAGVPSMSADLYDALGGSNYPTRESQMEAFTQHNPLTCLRDDDLEGLQVQSRRICRRCLHLLPGRISLLLAHLPASPPPALALA